MFRKQAESFMDWDLLVASDLDLGVSTLPVGGVAPPSKRSCLRAPGGVVSFWGRHCPPLRTLGTGILDPPAPDGGEGRRGQGTDQTVLGMPPRGVRAGEAAGRCA